MRIAEPPPPPRSEGGNGLKMNNKRLHSVLYRTDETAAETEAAAV